MKISFLIFFCLISSVTFCQDIISWNKNVYYFDTKDQNQHTHFKELVDSILKYENSQKAMLNVPILLDLSDGEKSHSYEVGYDNIYGTSLDSDIYKYKTWPYKTLGIRIQIYDSVVHKEDLIKLVDYGIKHFSELKRRRDKLKRLPVDDRPKNTSINQHEIEKILKN